MKYNNEAVQFKRKISTIVYKIQYDIEFDFTKRGLL